jgi:hypothetical protein
MATQIIAIPDQNGIIRVTCGTDELEILIASYAKGGDKEGGADGGAVGEKTRKEEGDSRGNKQADDDSGAEIHSADEIDPLEEIYILHFAPMLEGISPADIQPIVQSVETERVSARRTPTGIVLAQGSAVDIHVLADLSTQLRESMPGLEISVDFGLESKND